MSDIGTIEAVTENTLSRGPTTTTLVTTSIIIVNYNGRDYLAGCIQGIQTTTGRDVEIIVVDNNSTDGSPDQLADLFPEVRLIRSPENLGFAAGNNIGVEQASGRFLVFLNPDTRVSEGWLDELVAALETDPRTGLVTSTILQMDNPESISGCGNDVHLTGLTLARGMGLPASAFSVPEEITAVSGAAFAIRKEVFDKLGGFDSSFFMYMEDTDLSLRARAAGYSCIHVPTSVVYHDYALRFGPNKTFYQERNRYMMLLKNLKWRTLLVLLPSLLFAELLTWGFVFMRERNNYTNKLRAYGAIIKGWDEIVQKRGDLSKMKQTRDHDLVSLHTYHLPFEQTGGGLISALAHRLFDPLFFVLKTIALSLIRW